MNDATRAVPQPHPPPTQVATHNHESQSEIVPDVPEDGGTIDHKSAGIEDDVQSEPEVPSGYEIGSLYPDPDERYWTIHFVFPGSEFSPVSSPWSQ